MAEWHVNCPFPIGWIYMTIYPTNPADTRPGTAWVPFGEWRTIVCCSTNPQSALHKPQYKFWSASQQLTVVWQSIETWDEWSADVVTDVTPNESGKITISKYQPSITAYVWVRVEKKDVWSYNPFNITEEEASDAYLYWYNVIIDAQTLKPMQPNPYNMIDPGPEPEPDPDPDDQSQQQGPAGPVSWW